MYNKQAFFVSLLVFMFMFIFLFINNVLITIKPDIKEAVLKNLLKIIFIL